MFTMYMKVTKFLTLAFLLPMAIFALEEQLSSWPFVTGAIVSQAWLFSTFYLERQEMEAAVTERGFSPRWVHFIGATWIFSLIVSTLLVFTDSLQP